MNTAYWQDTAGMRSYAPLAEDLDVEAVVIGGGITGVTAAYALRRAGVDVVLLERGKLGGGETAHTTAHLTFMTDTRLSELLSTFGWERARLAWQGGLHAMEFIRDTVDRLGLTDCELRDVPGYLAAAAGKDLDQERMELGDEARIAARMGFDAVFLEKVPPHGRPGIRLGGQCKFHPLRYLQGLAREAHRLGARIHEHSDAVEFGEKGVLHANGRKVRHRHLVIATHVPLQGVAGPVSAGLFQSKLAGYSTYAIGAEAGNTGLEEMIWSDTADPFLYLRVEKTRDGDFLILGGEDHKTGRVERTGDAYKRLERELAGIVRDFRITHRWSGQVIETIDGLPYIGLDGCGQFIATGFSGNGMTYGTLAGLMACDAVKGGANRWSEGFSPARKTLSALPSYVGENLDFPIHMISGRLGVPAGDPAKLSCGCGRLMTVDGKRTAAYRDGGGELHLLDPVCPHLGCVVMWNETEGTWDCPCHGSRFTGEGELVAGPAETGLSLQFETAGSP